MQRDSRIIKMADNVVNKSVKVQKGEQVYIECFGASTKPLFEEMIAAVTKAGGIPFYFYNENEFIKDFIREASVEQIKAYAKSQQQIMASSDCYIGIRGYDDLFSFSELSDEINTNWSTYFHLLVHIQTRIPHTRWCVMRFPNTTMAAMSKMSLKDFEAFYFEACLVDYDKMEQAMSGLKALMEKTDKVKIIAPETYLEFSIKGIPVIKSIGTVNIPDGEIFTAPVRDSINGYVQFNTDSAYHDNMFSKIRLEFENGKIVKAKSLINDDLFQKILDMDEGSRYIGEFALGVNPYITKPILDILFDEKIGGSFHMAIGNSYDEAFNGNKSANHWDLIQMQDASHGGGEIWFDEVLIRKDGRFMLPELECLNPENLK